MSATKTPYELWSEAHGDPTRYVELMREAGHLVPRCPHLSRRLPRDRVVSSNDARCDREAGHPGDHTYGRNLFGHVRP